MQSTKSMPGSAFGNIPPLSEKSTTRYLVSTISTKSFSANGLPPGFEPNPWQACLAGLPFGSGLPMRCCAMLDVDAHGCGEP
jgi:hypothetical protein